jgi:hypothetical protein
MFLSIVALVNLDTATLTVEHPELAIEAPVVVGKPTTPTPEGLYVIEKAYSSYLNMPILIFRKDDDGIYAIHANIPSRHRQLASPTIADNRLSGGCIGVSSAEFDKLWRSKRVIVLQVYRGKQQEKGHER